MTSRRMYPSNPSVPTSQYPQQRSVNTVPNAYSSYSGVPSSVPPPNPTPSGENIASQFSGMNLGPRLQSSTHQPHPSQAPPINNGAIVGQSTGVPPTNPLQHGGMPVGPPPTGLISSRHTPPTSNNQLNTSMSSRSSVVPPSSMSGPPGGISPVSGPSRSGPPTGYHPQMDGSTMSHHINAPPISSSVSMISHSTGHHTMTGPPMGGPPTGAPSAGYRPQMDGPSTRHRTPLSGTPMGGFIPAPPTNKIEQPPSSMQLAPPPTGQLPLASYSSAPPLAGSSMSGSSLPPPPPPPSSSAYPQPNTLGTQPHSMVPQPQISMTQPHTMGTHPNMMGPQPHTAGTQPHTMGTHPNMMGPQPHTAGTQPRTMGTHSNMIGPQSHTAGTYIYNEVEAGGNPGISLAGPPPPTSNQMTAPSRQQYPHSAPKPPMGGVYPGAPPIQPHPSQMGPQAPPQQVLPDIQPVNLLESRNILPTTPLSYSTPLLPGHLRDHCPDPAVFCSTMSTVPATSSLLNKLKLPFAIHIHPFKDSKAKSCPVINPSVIVRCRVCRAYINPFVSFIDARHWRCNLCFRNNIVPEDYDYNPHTGKRGDRSHHAELRHASVEYIAPSEYMVRPPQPSVYFFVIDVTYPTVESGLLGLFCRTLLDCLTKLPGDGRTMVGFLTFDHNLHFYNLKPTQAQPQMLVVSDLDDPFIPSPNSLLVNLRESKELIKNLLEDLPRMFSDQHSVQSALGSALQVAEKLLHPIGGRITVLQTSIPNIGPGVIKMREQTSATKMDQLNMSAGSDFYKKLALECSAQQIAVDLFVFSNTSQFLDLPTISTVAKYSSGQIKYYQNFHYTKTVIKEQVERDFKRYFTRNIGFEAVMRIRCTEGLSLHTFHGNFFVRSTDLLSLPNVNPDHGYCMNMAIDESLKEFSMVCFQAALLYTTYRGERRIRVHTLCLPVSDQPAQIYAGLNIQAIIGVLAKMGADRMTTATLGDARDALVNTIQDATIAYRSILASSMQSSQFCLPASLRLLPLFTLSLLKHSALTLSSRVSLDSRSNSMNIIFTLPLNYLMSVFYPKLYALHSLSDKDLSDKDGVDEVTPPILQLSAEKLTRFGVFLMDYGLGIYIWVSKEVPQDIVKDIFGVPHFGAIPEYMMELPLLENTLSKLVNALINQIRTTRQHFMPLLVIREDGPHRLLFINYLIEDKTEDGTSYYEFLSHVARQITKNK